MNKRKVKIQDNMGGGCLIILTDAPVENIQKWIIDDNNLDYNILSKDYYVKVLHDPSIDPADNSYAIGYDELYDTYGVCLNDSENTIDKLWHRVKDEKPKNKKFVTVTIMHNITKQRSTADVVYDPETDSWLGINNHYEVVAWMEEPKPFNE